MSKAKPRQTPPVDPESQLRKLSAFALEAAEEEFRNGKPSSQLITLFAKPAMSREEVELERMRLENDLLRAKIEAMNSGNNLESMVAKVLDALRSYSHEPIEYEGDYDDW